jgi:hypothetical protein
VVKLAETVRGEGSKIFWGNVLYVFGNDFPDRPTLRGLGRFKIMLKHLPHIAPGKRPEPAPLPQKP